MNGSLEHIIRECLQVKKYLQLLCEQWFLSPDATLQSVTLPS